MIEPIEVHAPLSQVIARCRTHYMPGSMEPNTRNEFTLHAISQPMTRHEAEMLLAEWQGAVVDPGWEFGIYSADRKATQ